MQDRLPSPGFVMGMSSVWLVVSLSIILLAWYLRIGRTGITDQTALPFKMTGILVVSRTYVIPASGAILFSTALKVDNKRVVATILPMLLVVGSIGAIASLSRGFIVFCVFPPIMFMLLEGRERPWISQARISLFYSRCRRHCWRGSHDFQPPRICFCSWRFADG